MGLCIIYLRTSTEDQNPENQLKDCLSINHYGDYILLQDKTSAWKDTTYREDFEKLKKMVRARNVEHLIVWDFDRLYRNRMRFKEFLEMLRVYGVKLHSFRQQWLEDLHNVPTPWNDIVMDLMINIYGHIAEEESKKKSERVKIAVRRGENGTVSYRGNRWGRRPLSQAVIDQVLAAYSQKMSLRQIARTVHYWDNNNNKKFVSLAVVHKIIHQHALKN